MAIVSRQAAVVSFLCLEAISCGCSVTVLELAPEDTSPYDRIVMDASLGYCMSGSVPCRVVTLYTDVKNEHEVDVGEYWEWPVSLDEIRAFFVSENDDGVISEKERAPLASERPIIYLLSETNRTVLYRNRQISLSETEWRLLARLAEAVGETVRRTELLDLFSAEDGNIVDVYICHLRRKLEAPFGIRLFHTVRGKGYRLGAEWKRIQ